MSTILVTGGAGFIGSHLCQRFLTARHRVICIDNLISGNEQNISLYKNNSQFTFINHDICQPLHDDFGTLDCILHFASPASPNPDSSVSYLNHPIETLMVNTLGSKNMLELADSHHAQIIFASTSEVYGDPEVHPQPEEYVGHVSSTGPRSCYDEGKRAMEAFAFAYFRQRKTKIKVIRIFNTYGPRMRLDDGRFIPSLIDSVINNKTFFRYGDGSATRSFCYIDDLVEGIWQVFQTDQMIGQVVNLGNPLEFSVNEAIRVIEQVAGKTIQIQERSPLPDDPTRRRPDLAKAKQLLHWEPTTPLQEGLSKMLLSYAQN